VSPFPRDEAAICTDNLTGPRRPLRRKSRPDPRHSRTRAALATGRAPTVRRHQRSSIRAPITHQWPPDPDAKGGLTALSAVKRSIAADGSGALGRLTAHSAVNQPLARLTEREWSVHGSGADPSHPAPPTYHPARPPAPGRNRVGSNLSGTSIGPKTEAFGFT
jgi:hypothetical protein